MSRSMKNSDGDADTKAGYKTRGIVSTETTVDSPLRRSSRVKTVGKQNESSPDSPSSDNSNISSTQSGRNTRRRTDTQNNSTMSERSRSLRLRRSSVISDAIETTDKHTGVVVTPTKRTRNISTSEGVNKFDEQTSKRLTRAGSETKSPQIITRPTRRTRASSVGLEGVAENNVLEVHNSGLMHNTPVNTRKRRSMAPLGATVVEENEGNMSPFVSLDRVLPNLEKINETCSENTTTSKLNKSISKETLNSSFGNTSKEEMEANDGNANIEHATPAEHPTAEAVQETETSIIKNTLSDISEKSRSESMMTITQTKTSIPDVPKAQSPISTELTPRKLRLKNESTIKAEEEEEDEHLSGKENRASNIIEDPKSNDLAFPNILLMSNKSLKENNDDTDSSDAVQRLTATDTESLSEAPFNDSTSRSASCIEVCEDSSLDDNIQIMKCPDNVKNIDSVSSLNGCEDANALSVETQDDSNQDGDVPKTEESDTVTDKSFKFDDKKKEEIQRSTSNDETTAGDENIEMRLILEAEDTVEEDTEVCLTQTETAEAEYEGNNQSGVSNLSEECSKLSDMITDLDKISTSLIAATGETTMTDLRDTEMATNETTTKDLRETEVTAKVPSRVTKEPFDVRTESNNFELANKNENNTLSPVEPIDEASEKVDVSQDTSEVDDCSPSEEKSTNDTGRNEIAETVRKQEEEMQVDLSDAPTSEVDNHSPLKEKSTKDTERNEIAETVWKQEEEMQVDVSQDTSEVDECSLSEEKSTNDTGRNEIAGTVRKQEEEMQVDVSQDTSEVDDCSPSEEKSTKDTERNEIAETVSKQEEEMQVDASQDTPEVDECSPSEEKSTNDTGRKEIAETVPKQEEEMQVDASQDTLEVDDCSPSEEKSTNDTGRNEIAETVRKQDEEMQVDLSDAPTSEVDNRSPLKEKSTKDTERNEIEEEEEVDLSDARVDLFQDIPADEWKKERSFDENSMHSMSTERLENESENEFDDFVLVVKETSHSAENIGREKESSDYDSDDTILLKARKDSLKEKSNENKSATVKDTRRSLRQEEIVAAEVNSKTEEKRVENQTEEVRNAENVSTRTSLTNEASKRSPIDTRIENSTDSNSTNEIGQSLDTKSPSNKGERKFVRESVEKSDSEVDEKDSSIEFPIDSPSSVGDNDSNETDRSVDSDIEREYNLYGADVCKFSDDDVPGDECRASETESSDPDDDGSDLADFVVDDEISEEVESSELDEESSDADKNLESDATKDESDERRTKNRKQKRVSEKEESKSENDKHLESDATKDESDERRTKNRKQKKVSEKEESKSKNDKHLESDATKDESDERRTKNRKQRRISEKEESKSRNDKHLESDAMEDESDERRTKNRKQKRIGRGTDKVTILSGKKIKRSVEEEEEVDDEEKELEYGLRMLLEEETPERVTVKGQRKRVVEENVEALENRCTDIPKKEKGKLRKATKIKRSVEEEEEIGNKEKELADRLRMAFEEETPKKVQRKRVAEETVEVIETKHIDIPKKEKSKLRKATKLDLPLPESVKRKSEIETGNKTKKIKAEDDKMSKGKAAVIRENRPTVKRLAEEVVENLSDLPTKVSKRRKLSEPKEVPSRSIPRSELGKRNINVEQDLIRLSSYGSTSNFYVANLQKVKKSEKMTSGVKSFRQRMLNRNPRQPISYYTMFLEKQAASSKH